MIAIRDLGGSEDADLANVYVHCIVNTCFPEICSKFYCSACASLKAQILCLNTASISQGHHVRNLWVGDWIK